jgi:hypothetical protein
MVPFRARLRSQIFDCEFLTYLTFPAGDAPATGCHRRAPALPSTTARTAGCRYRPTMDSACLGRANNGSISVIFGPMFSGKTTELLRRMRRYQVSSDRFPSSPSRPMSR